MECSRESSRCFHFTPSVFHLLLLSPVQVLNTCWNSRSPRNKWEWNELPRWHKFPPRWRLNTWKRPSPGNSYSPPVLSSHPSSDWCFISSLPGWTDGLMDALLFLIHWRAVTLCYVLYKVWSVQSGSKKRNKRDVRVKERVFKRTWHWLDFPAYLISLQSTNISIGNSCYLLLESNQCLITLKLYPLYPLHYTLHPILSILILTRENQKVKAQSM